MFLVRTNNLMTSFKIHKLISQEDLASIHQGKLNLKILNF